MFIVVKAVATSPPTLTSTAVVCVSRSDLLQQTLHGLDVAPPPGFPAIALPPIWKRKHRTNEANLRELQSASDVVTCQRGLRCSADLLFSCQCRLRQL